MTIRRQIRDILRNEDINFLLTNRIPRQALTRFMGWFSKIEQPWVRDLSIAVWRFFGDLDLSEARKQSFRSMHDCFTRELKPGARPVDMSPGILTSPCDAIVGACGRIEGDTLIQAKGFPYTLGDLVPDPALQELHRDGTYVTLRLSSGMYHRFHAPHDCRVRSVLYFSGDTWNVNPIALRRVEKLFCRNERAVIRTDIVPSGHVVTLVPVAAVLVASMRFHFADVLLNLRYRGPNRIACDATLARGEEMGWFEHGSTIIVFAQKGAGLCDGVREGGTVRMGRPLMTLPPASS
ncbi:MAG: phosphatidylserine decarboxylase [Betaproteobacteria bacterium]|nr:phosphatidylserine decarboxylase [Betaproteobacteria bacterium]